jgi:hypothetical protein
MFQSNEKLFREGGEDLRRGGGEIHPGEFMKFNYEYKDETTSIWLFVLHRDSSLI